MLATGNRIKMTVQYSGFQPESAVSNESKNELEWVRKHINKLQNFNLV